ncbi:hypothetical protein JVT61DRAFT_7487 [Boletus reticuloceps]|uniref:Uncharacterized protein n=1 Tax=Boletus reticuloceps TaxID=495285 RepID=A0A8I2YIW5_9AGAM|nr:hypothetical protein JVT61DRAFT_7487 [Boletus reticuloceps]
MLVIPFLFQALSKIDYLHQLVRLFFPDDGMPISLIAASGMAYRGGIVASHTQPLSQWAALSRLQIEENGLLGSRKLVLVHGCTLQGNGITLKLLYLLRDKSLTLFNEPLHKVCKSRLVLFVAIQLIGFGATFSITQTIAAIGFSVVVLLLVPLRTLVIPRLPFTPEELAILDGPTAFPFTMESVGGSL